MSELMSPDGKYPAAVSGGGMKADSRAGKSRIALALKALNFNPNGSLSPDLGLRTTFDPAPIVNVF